MRRVLVTGGTSGLGRAIADRFLAAGHLVFVLGRRSRPSRRSTTLGDERYVRHDLRDLGRTRDVVDLVRREKIDCFVNCAGVYSDRGAEASSRDCADLLAVNLVAPVLILKDVYRHFKRQRGGIIVSVNSLAGITPNAREPVYSASKHGMRGFVGSLQIDAAASGVQILDYYLGAMRTPMTKGRPRFDRLIDPREVAGRIYEDATATRSYLPASQVIRRGGGAA